MLEAGTIRRVRQTLLSTSLAARRALRVGSPAGKPLDSAFEYMFREDPFSGHVVIRTTDAVTAGSTYRLWTTLKVPQGFSLRKHASGWRDRVGATRFRLMPAKMLFTLGVGHVRRRGLEPGARAERYAEPLDTTLVKLSDREWRALVALKREFAPNEIVRDLWASARARGGPGPCGFRRRRPFASERGVIGRFSTFLEHVKPTAGRGASDALQCALSLGRCARQRDGCRA